MANELLEVLGSSIKKIIWGRRFHMLNQEPTNTKVVVFNPNHVIIVNGKVYGRSASIGNGLLKTWNTYSVDMNYVIEQFGELGHIDGGEFF